MNKIKYNVILVVIFVLLITIMMIVETYALFESNGSGETDFDIADWVIYLNDNDVSETRTMTINNFTYTSGSHTQNGYFAPGSTVSFNLEINASNCQVAMEYELDIDDTAISEYPNISFSVTDLMTNTTDVTNNYTGVINLTNQSRLARLKVNLVWDNQSQYDESDTSLIDGELAFDITANFKQHISE